MEAIFRVHISDESVTPPRQRLNVMRRIGLIPQRLPQLLNCGIQTVIEVDKRIRCPEPLPQLFARYQLSRLLQQNFEDLDRLPLKLQPNAIFA